MSRHGVRCGRAGADGCIAWRGDSSDPVIDVDRVSASDRAPLQGGRAAGSNGHTGRNEAMLGVPLQPDEGGAVVAVGAAGLVTLTLTERLAPKRVPAGLLRRHCPACAPGVVEAVIATSKSAVAPAAASGTATAVLAVIASPLTKTSW